MASIIDEDGTFGPILQSMPDFTLVFEGWIFTILPTILLVLTTPFFLWRIVCKRHVVRAGALLPIKLTLGACLLGCEAANAGFWAVSQTYRTDVGIAAAALSCVGAFCLIAILYAEHTKSIQPSTFLSIYLSITLLLDVARTRSYFLRDNLQVISGFSIGIVMLKVALLLLEEVSKRDLVTGETGECTNDEMFSGFWNRTLFLWLNSTLLRGFRTILSVDNLQDILPEFRSEHVAQEFTLSWEATDKNSTYSLPLACLKALGSRFYMPIFLRLCIMALLYTQPFLVHRVMTAVGDPNISKSTSNGIIGAFCLVYFCLAIVQNMFRHLINKKIILLRGYLVTAIFAKLLTLDLFKARESAALTLMSTDLANIESAAANIHNTWSSVIGVGVGIFILSLFIGVSSIFVLIPVVVVTLLLKLLSSRIGPARKQWNEKVQHRITATSDVLQEIKGIKMSGLAEAVAKLLHSLQAIEIRSASKTRRLNVLIASLSSSAEVLTPVVVIAGGLFWTRGSTRLSTADIFATLSVVVLISEPLDQMITAFTRISSALACFQRIQDFLLLKQHHDGREKPTSLESAEQEFRTSSEKREYENIKYGVEVREISTTPLKDGRQILKDITAEFPPGKLSTITGPVGCGKSELLKALIGESDIFKGRIIADRDSMAYCDQTPWIRNVSVQSNIIGENPFAQDWYDAVTFACCLIGDFKQLEKGDKTIAGSNGCNLSGGQMQRVAVARAIYTRKPIIVLDDVFSSLDNTTSSTMFRRLFSPEGVLRRAKHTVIMTTNRSAHLSVADYLFSMNENGDISRHSAPSAPSDLLQASYLNHTPEKGSGDDESTTPTSATQQESQPPTSEKDAPAIPEEDAKERQRGDASLYWYYLKSFGTSRLIVWVLWTAISATMERFPLIFVRIWLSVDPSNNAYFGGYAASAVANVMIGAAMVLFYYTIVLTKSYANLHWTLLTKVMSATLSFFSVTDTGTLLTRFSQDMSLMGQVLPMTFFRVVYTFFTVIVEMGIIMSGTKFAAALIPVFLALFFFLQKFYLRTSRQLRHLDLEAAAPLYTLMSETSSGLQHIRCFQWTHIYSNRAIKFLDVSQKPYYNMLCAQQWLRLVLDLVVNVIAVVIVALALNVETSEAGIGLALIYLISFSQTVSNHLSQWVDLETSLGAISRLKTFERQTPSEPNDPITPEQENNLANWPTRGEIEFDHMSAKYNASVRTSPRVLDNVTFKIKAGNKVAIAGRTGCGKSSLVLTILGFLEYTGSIQIDGVEVRSIPLKILRSRITTLPQGAIVLHGSVRKNLDPFYDADLPESSPPAADDLMIDIMTRLEIWAHIEALGGLDADMKAMNLSPGQKQLMSLARAMVHHTHARTKIALMDEATSFMDAERNGRIQEVIDQVFANCTMIVVAHRDETIASMDSTLQMAEGRIISYTDRPLDNNPATPSLLSLNTASEEAEQDTTG